MVVCMSALGKQAHYIEVIKLLVSLISLFFPRWVGFRRKVGMTVYKNKGGRGMGGKKDLRRKGGRELQEKGIWGLGLEMKRGLSKLKGRRGDEGLREKEDGREKEMRE